MLGSPWAAAIGPTCHTQVCTPSIVCRPPAAWPLRCWPGGAAPRRSLRLHWRWRRRRQRARAPTCAAPTWAARAGRRRGRAPAASGAGGWMMGWGMESVGAEASSSQLKRAASVQHLDCTRSTVPSSQTGPSSLPSLAAPAVPCGTAAPPAPTPTGGRGTAACARRWARRGRRRRSGGGRRRLKLGRRPLRLSEQLDGMPTPHLDLHSASLHSAFLHSNPQAFVSPEPAPVKNVTISKSREGRIIKSSKAARGREGRD